MRLALAVAAGLLVPSLASAVELSGHLGLSYLRTDTWVDPAAHETSPRLDLDLGAAATGVLVSPEFMAWQLDAAWRRMSQSATNQRSTLSNSLYFGGRASLLNGARSPVHLSLDANRSWTTFSASSSADVTGETVTQSYGTQVSVKPEGLPTVAAGYRWNDYQNTIPGLERHDRTVQLLNAGTFIGGPAFKLSATYNGELSDGSWTTDRYDTHRAAVTLYAPLGERTELFVEEQFQITRPSSLSDPGAVQLDNNYLRAFSTNGGNYGDRHVVNYIYGHLLSQPAGGQISESARQAFRYEGDLLLTSPTLFTRWILDASINQARNGATALDTTGQTLALQLWWRRPGERTLVELWGGPIIGFIQSNTSGDSNGLGAAGQARLNQPLLGQDGTLIYRIDFGSDLYGAVGSSLRQNLTASLSGRLLTTGTYVASVSAGATKTSSPVLGDGAARSLHLNLTGAFRDLRLEAAVTLDEGVEGSTPKDFVSDGLFIPAPFNAHTLQTHGRGTYTILPGLAATAQVRWLSSEHPGHPTLDQTEVFGSLEYRYGAFVMSVEDRYGWNETATGAYKVNQFMFRIFRQIGMGR